MNVELVVTKTCHHCPMLETELKELEIPYSVLYIEDNPEIQERFGLRSSPNIMVDGELVFRGMPSKEQLQAMVQGKD